MHSAFTFGEALILIVSVTISFIATRLTKFPSIIGYLMVGLIIGPSGTGLLSDSAHIHNLSELGVMLLLFTIGLEVSPSKLWKLRQEALLGGTLQVVLTISIVFIIFALLGFPFSLSLTLGFFIALSSTALVIKMLQDKKTLDAPHGRFSLAVLLMQDIFVVPLTLIVPLLGTTSASSRHSSMALFFSLGMLILLIFLAKKVIPYFLDHAAALRSREGFFFTVTTLVLGTAALTTWAGLSPALGSFLAGLVVSETEYKHTALSEIIPFRDLFLTVFFVSIGMMLEIGAILNNPLPIFLLCFGIYTVKSFVVYIIVRFMGYFHTTAIKTAAGLGQVGEFSYVLLMIAQASDIIEGDALQVLISAAALTMIFTPFVFGGAGAALRYLDKKSDLTYQNEAFLTEGDKKHVIIIGFGPGGKAIARSLRELGFDYKISELNPKTVKDALKQGEPIILGDAAQTEILHTLDLERAMAVVIAISDYNAVIPIVSAIRKVKKDIFIIVRVRYVADARELKKYNIDVIIPAEMESSAQIAATLLHYLEIPANIIERHITELRQDVYNSDLNTKLPQFWGLQNNCEIRTITLENNDFALGKTLKELDLRNFSGTNIIAIVRGGVSLDNTGDVILQLGDALIISGTTPSVEKGLIFLTRRDIIK